MGLDIFRAFWLAVKVFAQTSYREVKKKAISMAAYVWVSIRGSHMFQQPLAIVQSGEVASTFQSWYAQVLADTYSSAVVSFCYLCKTLATYYRLLSFVAKELHLNLLLNESGERLVLHKYKDRIWPRACDGCTKPDRLHLIYFTLINTMLVGLVLIFVWHKIGAWHQDN